MVARAWKRPEYLSNGLTVDQATLLENAADEEEYLALGPYETRNANRLIAKGLLENVREVTGGRWVRITDDGRDELDGGSS